MKNFERITVDPAQMGGVPCVRHLRIPVATVLRLLAGGLSEAEILSEYPDLQTEDFASACASPPPQLWSGNCLFRTRLEIPYR
jgi:uncharacterized protein (DUF433 family)